MTQVGFKSDKGIKRGNNEDACFVVPTDNVYIVADGVGGSNAGEIASRTAVSRIAEYVRNNPLKEISGEEALRDYFMDCLTEVNDFVYAMDPDRNVKPGRATTVVFTYIDEEESIAYFVNVGDSRAYIFRNGKISQITEDHTYVNTLVKNGSITQAEARIHPNRNMITKALGGESTIEPDFFRLEIKPDDIIMLCTDGLHSEVEDEKLCEILGRGLTMSETCRALVEKANRSGGRDNITVICLKI